MIKFFNGIVLFSFFVSCFSNPLGASESSTLEIKRSKRKSSRADYVIVGVGTAGAVLAKKLSDDKVTSVIAIHNDKNLTQDPEIKFTKFVPTTVGSILFNSPFYETGETVPQPNADNRQILWGIGLPLGGASSINAGAYCRGTNQVYSQWEAVAGPEWSVSRIASIYKKLEHYHGKTNNPAARGFKGPLSVVQVANPSKVSLKFTQAIETATGLPFVLDYNDPTTPIGVSSQFQYTRSFPNIDLRASSATAFLNKKVMTPSGRGVDGRKLRVLFDSPALRTIWKGNKAIGVEFVKNGKVRKVYANKGVIVCAGLRSSPFLMHSGVGPKSLLESLDIPVVFDNPNVGNGLVDQPSVVTVFSANPEDAAIFSNDIFSQISWLPAPGGVQTTREFRIATANPVPGIVLLLVDLLQPRSRGSVTINSSNPLDSPVIDLGDFTNSTDLVLYQQAFQTYVKAINSTIHKMDPLYEMILPDPAVLDDINQLTAFIKGQVSCNQSFQSHCRMAPLDQGGVVDSTGHVYGVRNLIVADDSIVPVPMDGSTMASAYLIAANIARMLQGQ